MKVFISWSKPLSHSVAAACAEWRPNVVRGCRGPYVSSDTDKGEAWFQAITTELRQSKVGVVFITPQNVNEEWIHLEAGAIYAALDKQLCPVLVNLKKTDYDGPLRNIQMTELGDKADMLKLLRTLNKNCDMPLEDSVLEASFETWWPTLEAEVSTAIVEHPDVKPAEKRTVSDKVDEVLLLVRNLNLQAATSTKELEDREIDLMVARARLTREWDGKATALQTMKSFKAAYPESEFVVSAGEVVGRVRRVLPRKDDFLVEVWPFGKGEDRKPFRALASDLEFTDVPF